MKKLLAKLGIYDKESFWKFCVQFFKFGIVGLSNTGISLAIYYLFIWMNPGWYLWGNVVGWVIGVANSFFWNRKYVFQDTKGNAWVLVGKTYLAYSISFFVGMALLFAQVEWLCISEALAPILNLFVIVPLNFLVNKYWTFK